MIYIVDIVDVFLYILCIYLLYTLGRWRRAGLQCDMYTNVYIVRVAHMYVCIMQVCMGVCMCKKSVCLNACNGMHSCMFVRNACRALTHTITHTQTHPYTQTEAGQLRKGDFFDFKGKRCVVLKTSQQINVRAV
jgi:hypothetical protein